jgi:hypothetical protein
MLFQQILSNVRKSSREAMIVISTLILFLSFVKSFQNSSYCSRAFPAEGTWLQDKPLWNISVVPVILLK